MHLSLSNCSLSHSQHTHENFHLLLRQQQEDLPRDHELSPTSAFICLLISVDTKAWRSGGNGRTFFVSLVVHSCLRTTWNGGNFAGCVYQLGQKYSCISSVNFGQDWVFPQDLSWVYLQFEPVSMASILVQQSCQCTLWDQEYSSLEACSKNKCELYLQSQNSSHAYLDDKWVQLALVELTLLTKTWYLSMVHQGQFRFNHNKTSGLESTNLGGFSTGHIPILVHQCVQAH